MSQARLCQHTHDERFACPHCNAVRMGDATMTLETVVDALPLHPFIPVGEDGYARPQVHGLTLTCPDCDRPVRLRLTEDHVILVAARTDKDLRLIGEAGK